MLINLNKLRLLMATVTFLDSSATICQAKIKTCSVTFMKLSL